MTAPKGWPIFVGKKKKTQINKQYKTTTKLVPSLSQQKKKEGLEDRLQDADKEKTLKYY